MTALAGGEAYDRIGHAAAGPSTPAGILPRELDRPDVGNP